MGLYAHQREQYTKIIELVSILTCDSYKPRLNRCCWSSKLGTCIEAIRIVFENTCFKYNTSYRHA